MAPANRTKPIPKSTTPARRLGPENRGQTHCFEEPVGRKQDREPIEKEEAESDENDDECPAPEYPGLGCHRESLRPAHVWDSAATPSLNVRRTVRNDVSTPNQKRMDPSATAPTR